MDNMSIMSMEIAPLWQRRFIVAANGNRTWGPHKLASDIQDGKQLVIRTLYDRKFKQTDTSAILVTD